jgi:predicted amidohydrolase
MIEPYSVAAIQTRIRHVRKGANQQKTIKENLYRSIALIDYAAVRFGAARLVVLPEFWLTGAEHGRSVQDWTEVAPRVPGWETDALGEVCQEQKFYLAGATMEYDPTWPDRWFNCAFIIGPNGNILLKYRKHNCGNLSGVLNNTTPGDVYDAYIDRYGEEALFPVVETPIGRLACMVCFDVNFGETARMLAMRGADIICHPTGEPHGPHRPSWEMARRTRAFENGVYLISANHGEYLAAVDDEHFMDSPGWLFQERRRGEMAPPFRTAGGSEIVDYRGHVIGRAEGPGEAAITAEVNINALRRERQQHVTPLRASAIAPEYARARACPLNLFLDKPMQDRREGPQAMRATIKNFVDRGIFKSPDASVEPYTLSVLQTNIRDDRSPEASAENLNRSLALAEQAVARDNARVIVLPSGWLGQVAVLPHALSEFAAARGVYLAGATPESGFIIDDAGEVVLTYRRDAGQFPLVETPYGRLALVIDADVNVLELARILALKGAEIILHPTHEPYTAESEAVEQARRTRAYENMLYWASANFGSTSRGSQPHFASRGGSEIVNFDGKVLAVVDGPGEAILSACIDLQYLRWHKTRPYFNFLMHLRTDLYAPSYHRFGQGATSGVAELVQA